MNDDEELIEIIKELRSEIDKLLCRVNGLEYSSRGKCYPIETPFVVTCSSTSSILKIK